ncbi:Protein 5NUC [Escovopsis weberi]|uniref:Protein 5NUC n=1 Tax=Escovopsis weberi TaxID=150374 RepID=A0A0M8N141_ESCWE|nr:Protein 5NUC [Escovopsis weberi]
MKVIAALVAAAAAASCVSAAAFPPEDVLYSKRFQHRFLGSKGAPRKRVDDIPRDDDVTISFFHVNDVHAHLDQFSPSGSDCNEPGEGCYGGYARIKTQVDRLRAEHPNHLWLNAGDEFQGTMFFSFYGWEKIAATINQLGFDAMTLGNHEWDRADEQLGVFLKNLTVPIVSCNVRSRYKDLNETIRPYHIFPEHGIAVIGATTPDTLHTSHVGDLTRFLDPVEEIQRAIYEIRNTTGLRRIVALTHIGYDADQDLAARTEGLSLIVGGHSHTLLGDMPAAGGKYPTIVEDLAGNEVFIVTSFRWGEYIGSIDVTFGADGRALRYRGAPIRMDGSVAPDPALQAQVDEWRKPFDGFAREVIGSTRNALDQAACKTDDCLLGQVMADAMMDYAAGLASAGAGAGADAGDARPPALALINGGGVRAPIAAGNITRGQVVDAFPFGNAVARRDFLGADLRRIFEGAVSRVSQFNGMPVLSALQVSREVAVKYRPGRPAGSRLASVAIGGEPLDDVRAYRVVTVDFVASGGDNLVPKSTDFDSLETLDEVLTRFIQTHSPLENALERRLARLE